MTIYQRQPQQHGLRRTYAKGCHCLHCRKAEAHYRHELRRTWARGRLPLGARVPAAGTWKRLKQLLPEFNNQRGALALRLGAHTPKLQVQRTYVTVKTAQLVAALWQELMTIEGARV